MVQLVEELAVSPHAITPVEHARLERERKAAEKAAKA